MRFKIKEDGTLGVSLEQDGDDVNIIVTDTEGEKNIIAYLNETGLTICSGVGSNDIKSGLSGRIIFQED